MAGAGFGGRGSVGVSGAREPARAAAHANEAPASADADVVVDVAVNVSSTDAGVAPNAGVARNAASTDTGVAAEVSLAVAAKAAGENFPVALRVLPRRYRQHLTALYGFARLADDIGDEPLPGVAPGDTPARLRVLDALQADLARAYPPAPTRAGEETAEQARQEPSEPGEPGEESHPREQPDAAGGPRLPAIRALAATARECGIPRQPFDDLIAANRQDQQVKRYRTIEELVRYCELSANPVGLVVLYIFGVATTERVRLSDNICTALQLVEHWQDVAEDLANGRIYLPLEDMERFGCTEADLARATAGDNVKQLMAFETGRAVRMLDEGAALIGTLRGAARLAVAGYVAGGRAALAAIARGGYDVLRETPKPGKARTLAELIRCYVRGR